MDAMSRALLAFAALALACSGSRPALRNASQVGREAEIVAPDLQGREVRLSRDEGRVRVVDFWATWCEPCKDLLPLLDRLSKEYGERGLSVYGISFDEDRSLLESFLERTPVSFTVLWDKGGSRLSEKLDVQRLPTTLLVDRRGVIREVHLGFRPDDGAKLEAAVKRLLAEDVSPGG
jgi:cytochrome c biogenesis protein CcmG/thiol:disulfide interchange protein DsbE